MPDNAELNQDIGELRGSLGGLDRRVSALERGQGTILAEVKAVRTELRDHDTRKEPDPVPPAPATWDEVGRGAASRLLTPTGMTAVFLGISLLTGAANLPEVAEAARVLFRVDVQADHAEPGVLDGTSGASVPALPQPTP